MLWFIVCKMQVFAIFGVTKPAVVENQLLKNYPGRFRKVGEEAFFVSTQQETTTEVGMKVGFLADKAGEKSWGIIVPVDNYWGLYDGDLWEWIESRQGQDSASK